MVVNKRRNHTPVKIISFPHSGTDCRVNVKILGNDTEVVFLPLPHVQFLPVDQALARVRWRGRRCGPVLFYYESQERVVWCVSCVCVRGGGGGEREGMREWFMH